MKSKFSHWCIAIVLALGATRVFAQPAQKATVEQKHSTLPAKHKFGPFDISMDLRTRAEGWNWFQGNTRNSDYPFWNSLLRVGVGQTGERFDWFVEAEQPSILGLPSDAVALLLKGSWALCDLSRGCPFDRNRRSWL